MDIQSSYASQPGVDINQVQQLVQLHEGLPPIKTRSNSEIVALLSANKETIDKASLGMSDAENKEFRVSLELFIKNGAETILDAIAAAKNLLSFSLRKQAENLARETDEHTLPFPLANQISKAA